MRQNPPFSILFWCSAILLTLVIVLAPAENTSVESEPVVAEEPEARAVVNALPWAFTIEESAREDCVDKPLFAYEKGETVSWRTVRENRGEPVLEMKFRLSDLDSWGVSLTYLTSPNYVKVGQTLHWVRNGFGTGLAFRVHAIDRYGRVYLAAGCDSDILDKVPVGS